jgi:hypothetical protein
MSSTNHRERIHIVAITGSVRPGNFTGKALNLVAAEIDNQEGVSVEVIDPAQLDLALPGLGDSDDAKRLRVPVSSESLTKKETVSTSRPKSEFEESRRIWLIIFVGAYARALRSNEMARGTN